MPPESCATACQADRSGSLPKSITLMATGLLMAAPIFAQTAPVQKQNTQEMLLPSDSPGPNPPLKQR